MAKKKEKEVAQEPQIETVVEAPAPTPVPTPQPVVDVKPATRVKEKPNETWEIKDRMYNLKGNKKPLSRSIKSANCLLYTSDAADE